MRARRVSPKPGLERPWSAGTATGKRLTSESLGVAHSGAEARRGPGGIAFPPPHKDRTGCLPAPWRLGGFSSREIERDSLWDQENLVQRKDGTMSKVENMALNVTSRPRVQVAPNELGCHPSDDSLSCASHVGVLSRWGESLPNHLEMKATACHATRTSTALPALKK